MCHAPKKEYYKKFLFEPLPGGSTAPVATQVLTSIAFEWSPGRASQCNARLNHAALASLPSLPPAVESHLDHFLHDHMAAEVVTR